MKFVWTAILSIMLIACQSNTQDKAHVKTQKDSISYCIGMDIGRNMKRQSIDVDPEILAQGVKDMLTGSKTLLTDSEAQELMGGLRKQLMAKQQEKTLELVQKNEKEGEAFLAENKKKEGVQTTASGLQYKIITAGTGEKPTTKQTVTVNYRGTLIDGTEFDNSYKRGQPATHPVTGFIKGWTEALQLMPVGSKWQLFIPADLAYGAQGYGQTIGPNATLIFELELLSIK